MVPETGVGADHNWPQRMTMTTTNVEILRQGWLDAASALAPGLDTLPEFLEHGLEAAVIDERLDEQSLLRVVTEVTAAAADSLPAEELYFLTQAAAARRVRVPALPRRPSRAPAAPRREQWQRAQDTTLIGAEEVAALGRNGHVKTVAEPVARAQGHPEGGAGTRAGASGGARRRGTAEPVVEAQPDTQTRTPSPPRPRIVSRRASPSSTRTFRRRTYPDPEPEPSRRPSTDAEPDAAAAARAGNPPCIHALPSKRHRRVEARRPRQRMRAPPKPRPAAPASNGKAHRDPAPATNGCRRIRCAPATTPSAFVKPKDGFHLSDLADFAVVQRAVAGRAEAPRNPPRASMLSSGAGTRVHVSRSPRTRPSQRSFRPAGARPGERRRRAGLASSRRRCGPGARPQLRQRRRGRPIRNRPGGRRGTPRDQRSPSSPPLR